MEFAALVPAPDAIPASWEWFHGLSIVTFILHLLLMNAMLGSAIITFSGLILRRPAGLADARTASTALPGLIAFTVNAGVAPLLFVHVLYGQFIFTSSILMAWWWLSVVGLLLAAYAAAYLFDFRFDALGSARPWLLGGIVGALLTVAFIFTNNMTMMLAPQRWQRFLARPDGTLLNLADPMLLPRYLHVVTASVAVGGLALAWLWHRRAGAGEPNADNARDRAIRWFSGATALQFVVGAVFLFSLPQPARTALTGGDPWATALLVLSIAGGLAALHLGYRRRLAACTVATIFTVALMALVRDAVRRVLLSPYFSPQDLAVDAQTGPLILFLTALALGVAAVWFMLHLAFRRGKGGPA